MALFKGELSLYDILNMPKKQLIILKETRVNRLIEEQNSIERERKEQEKQNLRKQILQK